MKYVLLLFLFFLITCRVFAQQQFLTNPGFEGSFTTVAPGWNEITWGINVIPNVSYENETNIIHSGNSSQKIIVTDLGDGATILEQDFDFNAGKIFEGSVWLRANDSMLIAFMFQERVPVYHVPAMFIKKIGPSWEQLIIRGGYKRIIETDQLIIEGRFVIQPLDTGTLYIDDGSLVDITDSILNSPVADTSAISSRYFGMHVNKLGVHETYPPVGIGTMRLWNTGTEWITIEPTQGALSDSMNWIYDTTGTSGFGFRLDYYLNYILANDSGATVLYTMGQSPSWAAVDPASPPTNISDWQNYVNRLGNRYRSKINYWEVWNEADYSGSYSGTVDDLVELSQSTYQELKTIDPANNILAPNFTSAKGLAEFFYGGGGNYSDIISWHDYPSRMPEESIPEIIGMKNVMENYGYADKPLWNTEGAISIPINDSLTEEEDMAAVSRTQIIQWLFGIENFNWYCWDVYGDVTKKFTRLSYSSSPNQYDSLTPAGIAYRETVTWLTGAQVISKSVSNDTWIVELQRSGGYKARIVWNTSGTQIFNIPSSWNVLHIRDLYADTLIPSSSIQINGLPLLFENNFINNTETSRNERFDISIYPNPAGDKIKISSSNFKITCLSVFSLTGQKIQTLINENELVIDISDFTPGMYFLKIESGEERVIRKFIKL